MTCVSQTLTGRKSDYTFEETATVGVAHHRAKHPGRVAFANA